MRDHQGQPKRRCVMAADEFQSMRFFQRNRVRQAAGILNRNHVILQGRVQPRSIGRQPMREARRFNLI